MVWNLMSLNLRNLRTVAEKSFAFVFRYPKSILGALVILFLAIELTFSLSSSAGFAREVAIASYQRKTISAKADMDLQYQVNLLKKGVGEGSSGESRNDLIVIRRESARNTDVQNYVEAKCLEFTLKKSVILRTISFSKIFSNCEQESKRNYELLARMLTDSELMNTDHAKFCMREYRLYEDELDFPIADELSEFVGEEVIRWDAKELVKCLKPES
jgi:hypothetical protein